MACRGESTARMSESLRTSRLMALGTVRIGAAHRPVPDAGRARDPGQERLGPLLPRAAEPFGGAAGLHDVAVIHEDDLVSYLLGETHLVGNDDHGHAVICEV